MQVSTWGRSLKVAAYAVVALMGVAILYAGGIALLYWSGISV